MAIADLGYSGLQSVPAQLICNKTFFRDVYSLFLITTVKE